MDIKKVIVDLFDTHPKVNTFYMTSDGQFFEVKENANYHSQRLPKKGVAVVTREQAESIKGTFAASAAAAIAHPEQTTVLTQEQLDAKKQSDDDAQKALDNQLNGNAGTDDASHTVTQEELDNNPDLVASGAKVGDVISSAAEADVVKTALEKAQATPEADRTPYQKGLITKAANANNAQ